MQFAEIVVRVARKTDAAMWGALFAAVGSPSGILEGLLEGGALQSSACCLVIVDKLEGSPAAFALCLRLIKVQYLVGLPARDIIDSHLASSDGEGGEGGGVHNINFHEDCHLLLPLMVMDCFGCQCLM